MFAEIFSVSIVKYGEFLAERIESVKVEFVCYGADGIVSTCADKRAISIDEFGASAIVAGRVRASAVDSNDVALVFNRSCAKQSTPWLYAACRP